jgi:hypothetical protein
MTEKRRRQGRVANTPDCNCKNREMTSAAFKPHARMHTSRAEFNKTKYKPLVTSPNNFSALKMACSTP